MACPTFIPSLRLKDKIFLLFYPISAGFLRFISSLKSLLSPISPTIICLQFDSLLTQTVKNPPAMLETWARSLSWEDSPGEGHGYPLQYFGLENSLDREAWQTTVHEVAKSRIQLSDFHFTLCT